MYKAVSLKDVGAVLKQLELNGEEKPVAYLKKYCEERK